MSELCRFCYEYHVDNYSECIAGKLCPNCQKYTIPEDEHIPEDYELEMSNGHTHKIKGEDYYQCRKIKAERDTLQAEVDTLKDLCSDAATEFIGIRAMLATFNIKEAMKDCVICANKLRTAAGEKE